MKVVFIGSRGIPAKYGGIETFVEEISKRLVEKKFDVYVTCESDRFFEDTYKGIKRVHIKSIQGRNLTIPFINDFISTIYFLGKYSQDVDIVYYVASDGVLSALIAKLFRKRVIINPDGLEWKRLVKRGCFTPFYLAPLYLITAFSLYLACLLYTSPSPRDLSTSRMPSSA